MESFSGLSTAEIKAILSEEIAAAGGTMSDSFDDGTRLYARSILPWVGEVLPRDNIRGGVALRTTDGGVSVSPYLFRQVCRNGQIIAHAIEAQAVNFNLAPTPEDADRVVRQAIQACAKKDVFTGQLHKMRALPQTQTDLMLTMMPLLSMLSPRIRMRVLADIGNRFDRENDSTLYGVLNAIASAARDTGDPELRWQLEEMGGAVLASGPSAPRRSKRVTKREMAYA